VKYKKHPKWEKHAEINRMCSHCGDYADIVDEFNHIKLCSSCYNRLELSDKQE